MKSGNAAGAAAALTVLLLLFSCASDPGFMNYRQGMFIGTDALQNGDLPKALQQFVRASEGEPDKPMPPALAGMTAYQMGDYGNAARFLSRAKALDPDQSSMACVVVSGYTALIAFREGKREEGMAALALYLKLYEQSYPDRTLQQVRAIYQSGDIRVPALESLINDGMNRYVKEVALVF